MNLEQAHEMSFDEYKKFQRGFLGDRYEVVFETGIFEVDGKKYNGGVVREEHYKLTRQAVRDGKEVSPKALVDYPNLIKANK